MGWKNAENTDQHFEILSTNVTFARKCEGRLRLNNKKKSGL